MAESRVQLPEPDVDETGPYVQLGFCRAIPGSEERVEAFILGLVEPIRVEPGNVAFEGRHAFAAIADTVLTPVILGWHSPMYHPMVSLAFSVGLPAQPLIHVRREWLRVPADQPRHRERGAGQRHRQPRPGQGHRPLPRLQLHTAVLGDPESAVGV